MPFSVLSPTIQEKEEYKWQGITRDDLPEMWQLLQNVNRLDNKDYTETFNQVSSSLSAQQKAAVAKRIDEWKAAHKVTSN